MLVTILTLKDLSALLTIHISEHISPIYPFVCQRKQRSRFALICLVYSFSAVSDFSLCHSIIRESVQFLVCLSLIFFFFFLSFFTDLDRPLLWIRTSFHFSNDHCVLIFSSPQPKAKNLREWRKLKSTEVSPKWWRWFKNVVQNDMKTQETSVVIVAICDVLCVWLCVAS